MKRILLALALATPMLAGCIIIADGHHPDDERHVHQSSRS